MARSRLTYAEAVKLLNGGPDKLDLLNRLAGGVLLLAAPFTGVALSLFDAKGEANALLRDLLDRAPGRIRASRGRSHYELIEAAHTVLVISSYFDAFAELARPLAQSLDLTDDERRRIAGHGLLDLAAPPLPGATRGAAETLTAMEPVMRGIHASLIDFAAGLAVARRLMLPPAGAVVRRALELYGERYVRLAADVPEFLIWAQLNEHAATRATVRGQTETLTRLADLLSTVVQGGNPAADAERRLAAQARRVLDRPLWRTTAAGDLSFPTVAQGFVSPRFRIVSANNASPLGDESWWERTPQRSDLSEFLAACLSDPVFTERPLVVLGHPGAGKSLLTEVLAARLPAEAFTTIRVPLRSVDPDAPVHKQVEATVERLVKEPISWGQLCRASDTTKVILLDGFDELVQATGIAQSHYIERIASFQQDEWVNGRPVVVIVTSRTLVMDRTVVPDGTVVMKLDPFDDEQIGRWTAAWNAANAHDPTFRHLSTDELLPHEELAGQPLLLLMLAVYAAESGARLDREDLAADELYRRLLDTFIRRQVREKGADDLAGPRLAELEVEARHDLAVAAFAMFNRGLQHVREDDLGRDLDALRPLADAPQPRLGEPLTRAKSTVAAFFFVHVAQADDDARSPGRRTYEFLHATFAEYLVAEHTIELLDEIAEDHRRPRRRAYGTGVDDTALRNLLSHQPLTNGEQIVPFLAALIDRMPADARANLQATLLDVFRTARKRVNDGDYRPTPFDAVNRLAAYTANLVLLAALCDEDGVSVDALCGAPDAPSFESTVRLWRSGLDAGAQNGLFGILLRRDGRIAVDEVDDTWLPEREAHLAGDTFTGAALRAGRQAWNGGFPDDMTDLDGRQLAELLDLFLIRWPMPGPGRMMPYDERNYRRWADAVMQSGARLQRATARMLAACLVRDAGELEPALLETLVQILVESGRIASSQPLPALLAVRAPWLLGRFPTLGDGMSAESRFFVYSTALLADAHDDLTAYADKLRAGLPAGASLNIGSIATPSMLAHMHEMPSLVRRILVGLDEFGILAWSQVRPTTLLAAAEILEDRGEFQSWLVAGYVESRDQEVFEGEDAVAFERLRKLARS
ncbi:hypothetical protein AB0M46_40435 [Dactylosporangium sp. NPDC051485]|uniref:NACHT domain-containing protein n=1 Tax=Dactylosporangium sp. NPDC051485 TaxID=3154846 RepID=UPI00342B73EE